MTKYATAALLLLLLATTTYGQDEDTGLGIEDFGIEYCKWMSILAKEIMTARQNDKPMSETLPFALDLLRDFPKDMGVDIEELSEDLEEAEQAELAALADLLAEIEPFFQEMKPVVTQMVMSAYEVPTFSSEGNQRDAISAFENTVFASCYEGYEEEAADLDAESNRLDTMPANAEAAYMFAIQQKVERNWVRPANVEVGLECIVNVRQLPGGEVVDVSLGRCNGDETVKRSIESAVYKSS